MFFNLLILCSNFFYKLYLENKKTKKIIDKFENLKSEVIDWFVQNFYNTKSEKFDGECSWNPTNFNEYYVNDYIDKLEKIEGIIFDHGNPNYIGSEARLSYETTKKLNKLVIKNKKFIKLINSYSTLSLLENLEENKKVNNIFNDEEEKIIWD
ncbi:hypothetical protein [Spiroplasma syrphidicola]|nr:hypothetical protein [Spiroplasma syrphidicola]